MIKKMLTCQPNKHPVATSILFKPLFENALHAAGNLPEKCEAMANHGILH